MTEPSGNVGAAVGASANSVTITWDGVLAPDEEAAARMLAALALCPEGRPRLETLAAVAKILVEYPGQLDVIRGVRGEPC